MAIREIHTFPDAVLKRPAEAVTDIDGTIAALVEDMAETMYAAPGIGLAAPQVGVSQRILVLDVPHKDEGPGKRLMKLVNPEIVERDGSIVWEEGCLSVPDFTAPVTRAKRILLRAWTPEQKEIEIEAEELLAVALQHEIDHLDGKLFLDRLSRLKRDLYRRGSASWSVKADRRTIRAARALAATRFERHDALAHPLHGDAALRRDDSRGAAPAARSGGRRRVPARPSAGPGAHDRAAGGEDAGPGARRARIAARAGPRPERPRRSPCARARPRRGGRLRAHPTARDPRPAAARLHQRARVDPAAAPRRRADRVRHHGGRPGDRRQHHGDERGDGRGRCAPGARDADPCRRHHGDAHRAPGGTRWRRDRRRHRRPARRHASRDAAARRRRHFAPRIERTHARLVWARPAGELERLVRAMRPRRRRSPRSAARPQGAPRGARSRRRRPGDPGHGDRRDARRHRRRDGRRRTAAARRAARGQAAARCGGVPAGHRLPPGTCLGG